MMIKEVCITSYIVTGLQLMILTNFVSIGDCFNVSMTDQSKSQQIVQKQVSLCYVFSSHIFFTAGLEAPRGIFFDLSIVREENPFLSALFSPFSLTIFRQDTYKRSILLVFMCQDMVLNIYTNFNSKAPTFFNKSPTIPSAEILQSMLILVSVSRICRLYNVVRT